MAGIVESRVRPNIYARCSISSDTASTEQDCRDIADMLLIQLNWRIFGSVPELSDKRVPAAFTLERRDDGWTLHALLRCPETLSIRDFCALLADEWQKGSWQPDEIEIRLRDAACVRQAVTHGLDTFLITT